MKRRARTLLRRLSWRRRLGTIGAFLALAAIGGFVYAWAGLAPISARSGHWSATAWFLHFAMRQGVETRAAVSVAKPEDVDVADPALALRGAPHFAGGCAPCHGAPGQARSAIARAMTPQPPRLESRIPDWSDEELFWIVQNGIKFSAMPAWPAEHREDEVWSMVAFLRRLPGMTPAEWSRLAGLEEAAPAPVREAALAPGGPEAPGGGTRLRRLVDPPIGEILAESCVRCHGADGLGRGEGAFPKLAGQKEAYLHASLRAYARDARQSGFMRPVAVGLTDAQMRGLAEYYAGLPAGPAGAPVSDAGARALGERVATIGVPERGVPACASCHGPETSPWYPLISGQDERYLALQLEAWRDGDRGGTVFAQVMRMAAERLTDAEIAAVSAWYAAQGAPMRR
ncbi:c-type cytochrome [Salinarimonas rosea]|uniref:c-type cytochrome n=1 Tax=Salinarimonas rosea TaxID=552063 RepID=UPI000410CC8A|nr:c-type cytochrome [Salinarimonas rosea]